jgi:hypothetical protein
MMKMAASIIRAASTSEMPVNFYQTTQRYNPEDSHLYTRRRENLKSNNSMMFRKASNFKSLNMCAFSYAPTSAIPLATGRQSAHPVPAPLLPCFYWVEQKVFAFLK